MNFRKFQFGIKRFSDIILSVFFFILLLPFWIIIPVLIKIDSPGRAIYTQKRIGINSSFFTIYKYRTMLEGTPDIPTDQVTDSKKLVTKFGAFLRRTSIDEFPQLVNIIKGEMSFVGPRPALYNQPLLIKLRKEKGADAVRPGITGLAQVMGRDDLPIPVKVDFDTRYVSDFSLLLDLKILFLTIKAIFSGRGSK